MMEKPYAFCRTEYQKQYVQINENLVQEKNMKHLRTFEHRVMQFAYETPYLPTPKNAITNKKTLYLAERIEKTVVF